MNISALFKAIVVVALALFAAIYLGISTATAQYETVAWVIGGVTLIGDDGLCSRYETALNLAGIASEGV